MTDECRSHFLVAQVSNEISLLKYCGILCIFLFAVAVWSAVNVAGTRLQDLHPDIGKANDPENWDNVHRDVINRLQ